MAEKYEKEPLSKLFPNLAEKMDEQFLSDIGRRAVEGYDNDEASRTVLMKRIQNWTRLASVYPEQEVKQTPWEGAANIVIPMISIACIQFQSRAEDALLSSKEIVKGSPIGFEKSDKDRAERIAQDMNYQLQYKMPNYFDGISTSLMSLPLVGTMHRKTYYDEIQKTNVADFVPLQNLCINYWARDIETAPRITQVHDMQYDDIQARIDDGIFLDIDLQNINSYVDVDNVKAQSDEINGIEQPEPDETTPRKILEQHTKIKLKTDSKRKTPVVIFVDYDTQKVLRIVSRINPYKEKPDNVINYYTKYTFIPAADGSYYGMGFGLLLERANETVNTLINQLTDAGTLANRQGGFILKRSGLPRGSLSYKLGEFKEVDSKSVDDIRKAIFQMNFKEPSGTLFQLLSLLQDYANRVTTVSEAMTGDMPRSGVGSMGVVNLLEQGLKVFASIFKRIHRSYGKELQKLYDLNGIYRDINEYRKIVVNSDFVSPEEAALIIGIDDYRSPLDIMPVSDPNIISKSEKAAKAQAQYQTVMSNPLFAQNVESNFYATEQYLKSFDSNEAEVEQILAPIRQQVQMAQMQREQQMIQAQQQQQVLAQQQQAIELVNTGLARAIVPQELLAQAIQNEVAAQNQGLGLPQR